MILPGIFPYLVTGLVTASGGAWNASIIAEYYSLHGHTLQTVGLGAQISAPPITANSPFCSPPLSSWPQWWLPLTALCGESFTASPKPDINSGGDRPGMQLPHTHLHPTAIAKD